LLCSAWFAWLMLGFGFDAPARAARSRPRAKMGGGSVACFAHIACACCCWRGVGGTALVGNHWQCWSIGIGLLLVCRRMRCCTAEDGEGTAVLALLGLCRYLADDASACAVLSRPSKKVGGGQQCSCCWQPRETLGGGAATLALLTSPGLHLLASARCWG
jgi:hypothetical protein